MTTEPQYPCLYQIWCFTCSHTHSQGDNGCTGDVACIWHQDVGVPLWTLSLLPLLLNLLSSSLLWFEVMSFTSLISLHPALSLLRPFVSKYGMLTFFLSLPSLFHSSDHFVSALMRLTSSSLYWSLGPPLLPVHPSGAWSLLIPTNHYNRPLAHKVVFVQFPIRPPAWSKRLCKWWRYKAGEVHGSVPKHGFSYGESILRHHVYAHEDWHKGFIYPSRRRQSHNADSDELGIKK